MNLILNVAHIALERLGSVLDLFFFSELFFTSAFHSLKHKANNKKVSRIYMRINWYLSSSSPNFSEPSSGNKE